MTNTPTGASPITMTPHTRQMLEALLAGKTIQMRRRVMLGNSALSSEWVDLTPEKVLYWLGGDLGINNYEFRVKPEPVVLYARVFKTLPVGGQPFAVPILFDYGSNDRAQCVASGKADKILRVEIDPTTWDVKAEIEDV